MGNDCMKHIPWCTVGEDDDDDDAYWKRPVYHQGTNIVFQYHKGSSALEYWEPIKLLGEGSMSSIHLVRRRQKPVKVPYKERMDVMETSGGNIEIKPGEKLYALKSIMKNHVKNDIFLEEMRTEIENMSELDHPNIAHVYEAYERKRHIRMVMEFCSGGDLYQRGPYTEPQAANIVRQIVGAVVYMHRHKVVHRDLKFENIMFESNDENAHVKIIDFGIATKYLSDEHRRMRQRVGTVYTMAPQVLQGVYTSQCDMWSIGVITFMLLSGFRPFEGHNRSVVIDKILRCDYDFKDEVWENISPEAKEFVRCLIRMNPTYRLSAREALQHTWLVNAFKDRNGILTRTHTKVFRAMKEYGEETRLKRVALILIAHQLPISSVSDLRDIFMAHDTNNDGSLSFNEFRAAMSDKGLNTEEIDKMFNDFDVRRTGQIDFTEFIAGALSAKIDIEIGRINETFDKLDTGHKGFITKKDLRTVLGDDTSDYFLADIVKEVDVDNDGLVSRDEFIALFEKKAIETACEICDGENESLNLVTEQNCVIPGGCKILNDDAVYSYDEKEDTVKLIEELESVEIIFH